MSAETKPISTSLLDTLIDADTLAERLSIRRRTVDEWRITGKGPKFIRIGRSVRYNPESVDSWLLSNEHNSTVEEVRK